MKKKIWRAAELEKMTPAEVRDISDSAMVADLAEVDPEFLGRAQDAARSHMADNGQQQAS